tara:strand:+ start:390 stop:584 length:195 start_codon:yes stop_codon:yes gene_type:complete
MNTLFGILLLILMAWFAYVSSHMVSEKKAGKHIPLLWEKGGLFNRVNRKIFDKSDIVYRDGDNT